MATTRMTRSELEDRIAELEEENEALTEKLDSIKRHEQKQKADLRAEVTFFTDLYDQAIAQSQPSKPESSSTPT